MGRAVSNSLLDWTPITLDPSVHEGATEEGGKETFEVTFFFVKTGEIFNTGKDVGIPQLMCKVQQGEHGLCGVVGWILRLAVLALGCECCLAPGWS